MNNLPEFNKLFKKSSSRKSNKIPGIGHSDSESSSDSRDSDHIQQMTNENNKNKQNEDHEYIPTGLSIVVNSPQYIPERLPTFETRRPITPTLSPVHSKTKTSPLCSPPICNKDVKQISATKRRNSISAVAVSTKKSTEGKRIKTDTKNEMNENKKTASIQKVQQQQQPLSSMVEIKDSIIYLVHKPKKTLFSINLQIPIKYMKNILPIFHKGIKLDLFVQHENSDNLWANISMKSIDNHKIPIPLYTIINVDEQIINNIRVAMNNSIEFKEVILNKISDKNFKIYDECGIICIHDEDKSLYSNGRIELKKNITYIFNTSLNIMFAHRYINVQAEKYKCTICSRNDNNFLTCLIITVTEAHIIENGIKLMHFI